MNILYLGYRDWAYQILKKLLKKARNDWKICAVITTPQLEAKYTSLSIPCYKLNPKQNNKILNLIKKYRPDVILAYGWSWIIPKTIYSKYSTLILHTSPLPKYRGGSPIQHQIMAGEKNSAISIFKADGGLDTGDIFAQVPFSLSGTLNQIFRRIAIVGTKATLQVLEGLSKNNIKPMPQDNSKATTFMRRRPEESRLTADDFKHKTSEELYNFIRALTDPYPNAYIVCKDGRKLYFKEVTSEQ